MFRRLQRNSIIRQLMMLSVLPLALTGTGYALFSQDLHINANVTKPAYSANQNLYFAYTTTETAGKNTINYTLSPVTITNKGSIAINSWQATFDVPSDVSHVSCSSSVTCKKSGTTVTVTSGTANSTLLAGTATDFTMSFASSISKYTLQNITIGGTYAATYQPVAGLSVNFTQGATTQHGSQYSYPHTFTVTNKSAQTIFAWQVTCTWTDNPFSVSADPTVDYASNLNTITFTGSTAISPNNSTSFTSVFTAKSDTWALTACNALGGS